MYRVWLVNADLPCRTFEKTFPLYGAVSGERQDTTLPHNLFRTVVLGAFILAPASTQAGCAQVGLTVTCTGSGIDNVQLAYEAAASAHDSSVVLEDLTQSSISGAGPLISIQASAIEGDSGTAQPGETVGTTNVSVNADVGVDPLALNSLIYPSAYLFFTGGKGATPGESKGSGTQKAAGGGMGGSGGTATLTFSAVTTNGFAGLGISGTGGKAGSGAEAFSTSGGEAQGGAGGDGGTGTVLDLNLTNVDIVSTSDEPAISLFSLGGDAGNGGTAKGAEGKTGDGGAGGAGGKGGAISLDISGNLEIQSQGIGVLIQSFAGTSGSGGLAEANGDLTIPGTSNGGTGGAGADGGDVKIVATENSAVKIEASTLGGIAIQSVASKGGNGNTGEDAGSGGNSGGDGGVGGTGGSVTLSLAQGDNQLASKGDEVQGILARSYGASGGDGGSAGEDGKNGHGGATAGSGPGGSVDVEYLGGITTNGANANAIFLQSIGGFDGDPLSANFLAYATGEQSAGPGGAVDFHWHDSSGDVIQTMGDYSNGILAQSIGGGGGAGTGDSYGSAVIGSKGEAGGDGAAVSVTTSGAKDIIDTTGDYSSGIDAQSVGGGGGNGVSAQAVDAIGGSGSQGGAGGSVTVSSATAIQTAGADAYGIHVQSIGGGGGKAPSVSGVSAIGAAGGAGGHGGTVSVTNDGNIQTAGDNADAVFAQSHGGGGGRGSNAVAVGVSFAHAVGGSGGSGGNGGYVTVATGIDLTGLDILTRGHAARGIVAQSGGGGGGHGGNALSFSGSPFPSVAIAVGGSGGGGGEGGRVLLETGDTGVTTTGDNSAAVFASSYGGGGGSAGTTLAANDSVTVAITKTVGGSGGSGGRADTAEVCHGFGSGAGFCDNDPAIKGGTIVTYGDGSDGIIASSIGGGGGHSGTTLSAAEGTFGNIQITTGGSGGGGGNGEAVAAYSSGDIMTFGQQSTGILAKSVGGGGGAAYLTASGSGMTTADVSVTIGGKGGNAGGAGQVRVVSEGSITTSGAMADGITALSIAKSGGIGGVTADVSGISTAAVEVGLGGNGGSGGTADFVDVVWGGNAITTSGGQSLGIHAASQGGSGGRGGFDVVGQAGAVGTVQVGIGGEGGTGGTSGDVTVGTTNSAGLISTSGDMSSGLAATTQGGHGGRGGATLNSTGGSVGGVNISVGLGGNGGGGGTAGAVTVSNAASIQTSGSQSNGIEALSQGGSGGTGGFVFEGGFSTEIPLTEDEPEIDVTIALGGSGGGGGTADTVSLTNLGNITTTNFSSVGIDAKSMGGNGGNGGAVYTANLNVQASQSFQETFDIGGDGGGGGKGAEVLVSNFGSISTSADNSAGVFAQSSGGSGGYGGGSYSGVLNFDSQTKTSQSFTLNVGGSGGGGAVGGPVSVSHEGSVTTNGVNSVGIMAQSLGGSGGYGGNGGTIAVNASRVPADKTSGYNLTGQATVGGTGGSGMNAAPATITVTGGDVTTTGATSVGIYAQSAGGGGGVGGTASTYNVALSGKCGLTGSGFIQSCRQSSGGESQTSYSVDVNIGGSGGAGGAGDVAEVDLLDAAVGTLGDAAHAIFTQSIGGGGGSGGSGSTGITAFTSNKAGNTIANIISGGTGDDPYTVLKSYGSWTIGVGGKGGAAGNGAAASVFGFGQFSTSGVASHGIFAQSVGGGGGTGGSAGSSLIYGVTVGGSGSGGGDGGNVDIMTTHGTNIRTAGDGAYGILAQSIGGGGGESGLKKSGTIVDFSSQAIVQVGGSNGKSGTSGAVTITNAGAGIVTRGADAVGIFGQSVGGGGGLAPGGYGASATGSISVGGVGATGTGDDVAIDHTGSIETGTGQATLANVAAHGIVAQSVGGGGGYAGAVVMGSASNFGRNVNIGNGGNTSGDGGNVSVSMTGALMTQGGSSVGILAQSVGGGGGVQGSTDTASVAASDAVLIGTSGGSGKSGTVAVTYTGSGGRLATNGAGAHGIFAQSAGGSVNSAFQSPVSININGHVSAPGAGAHGIFAQTAGTNTGSVDIGISTGGSVTGGTLASVSGAERGAGLFILSNGTADKVTNAGVIASVDGAAGDAITYKNFYSNKLTVDNTGTITGNINGSTQGAVAVSGSRRAIDLFNRAGGVVNAGMAIDADRVLNAGRLSPSGSASTGTTRIAGDLVQTETGVLAIDLETTGNGQTDQLVVEGRTELGGAIAVSLTDSATPLLGARSSQIVSSSGGITLAEDLSLTKSAVARYHLHRTSPASLSLSYDIDFANDDLLASLTGNQAAVAAYIQRLYSSSALDVTLSDVLLAAEDGDSYSQIVNTMTPEVAINTQMTALAAQLRFNNSLLSCNDRLDTISGEEARVLDDGRCLFLRAEGTRFMRDATSDNLGFTGRGWELSLGGQAPLDEEWSLGGAIAYEQSTIEASASNASGDGTLFLAGILATRWIGALALSGSFAVGRGDYDIERRPLSDVVASGHQEFWLTGGQLRAEWMLESGNTYIKPGVGIAYNHVSSSNFTEQGSNSARLDVSTDAQSFLSVQPTVEFGGDYVSANGSLWRPRLTLGLTQFLNNAQSSLVAGFSNTAPDIPSFRTTSAIDKTRFDIAAHVDVFTRRGATFGVGAFASVSQNSQITGGFLRMEIPF